MTAALATLAGRAAASRLMVDTCTITRGPGAETFDPATGEYVTSAPVTLYTGPCRVKAAGVDVVTQAPGQADSLLPFEVSVPITAVAFAVDDVVTITASQLDPALVGLVLRVTLIPAGSHLTARRLGCERDAG